MENAGVEAPAAADTVTASLPPVHHTAGGTLPRLGGWPDITLRTIGDGSRAPTKFSTLGAANVCVEPGRSAQYVGETVQAPCTVTPQVAGLGVPSEANVYAMKGCAGEMGADECRTST